MKSKNLLKLLIIVISFASCTDNELWFTQYFIENTTDKTIYLKVYFTHKQATTLEIKSKKRVFLDGYLTTGDVRPPAGISTIRADSAIIELANGKRFSDACYPAFPPQNCTGRSLFNNQSYKLVKDEGKISFSNRIFEFDENDAKNAK